MEGRMLPQGRLASLDLGRMIACLAVVVFHANIDVDVFDGESTVLVWGQYGVEFFMVLSGYVLSRPFFEGVGASGRRLRLGPYLRRRFVRIAPPYYVVVLLGATLALAGQGGAQGPIPRAQLPWHVATHLAFIHTWFPETHLSLVSVLWSLGLEWQYYLLFPVLLVAMRRYPPPLIFALALFICLAFRAVVIAVVPYAQGHLLNGIFLARFTEFTFGVTFAALLGRAKDRARALSLLWAVSLLAAALITLVWFFPGPVFRELAVQGVIFFLFAVLRLVGPADVTALPLRVLRFLGEVSYSTYLVHTLAGKASLRVADRIGMNDASTATAYLRFALYVVAAHAMGVIFFWLIERPLTRWAAALLRVTPPRFEEGARARS
jgi:peptidoglycan/LPS O-acetylase OafA/YrhL